MALELLAVGAIPVACRCLVVLLLQPGIDELLPGMVDQLAAAVNEIQVAPIGQLHVAAHLFNASKAHIHQQDTPLCGSVPGQLDIAAEGNHPLVVVVRVLEEILDMWRREMEVLLLLKRREEPARLRQVRWLFQGA